jgi:hypothetical protein
MPEFHGVRQANVATFLTQAVPSEDAERFGKRDDGCMNEAWTEEPQ